MGIKKRQKWEVDILDTENGRTYTYSTKGYVLRSCSPCSMRRPSGVAIPAQEDMS